MNYNNFTISYIQKIKSNLNIEIGDNGLPVFFPDSITTDNLVKLKLDIQGIWEDSKEAINIVSSKHDAKIQAGLFGLVNDLDKAVKVGFLLADRVVLLDYLFERILLKKAAKDINISLLGVLATFLVSLLDLAKIGRVVIIPNPLSWHLPTKQTMIEVSEKTTLTPDLMSMLNILSIAKICNLQPYTIAESEKEYLSIINNRIDYTSVAGLDVSKYAYEGILGGLLSEKLTSKTEFRSMLNIPVNDFYQTVSKYDEFHLSFLNRITPGGSLRAENNIDRLSKQIISKNEACKVFDYSKLTKPASALMGLGGGTIALAGAVSVLSTPIGIAGAALSLSATLAGLVSPQKDHDDIVISLFNELVETNNT